MIHTFVIGQKARLKPIDSHTSTKTQLIVDIDNIPDPGSFDGETRQLLVFHSGKKVLGAHCVPA